jgi:hypothetical protein
MGIKGVLEVLKVLRVLKVINKWHYDEKVIKINL